VWKNRCSTGPCQGTSGGVGGEVVVVVVATGAVGGLTAGRLRGDGGRAAALTPVLQPLATSAVTRTGRHVRIDIDARRVRRTAIRRCTHGTRRRRPNCLVLCRDVSCGLLWAPVISD